MLKLDPKNTELLKQKQDILNSSIATTEDKLKQLKQIKDEADKKMAEGTKINEENYRALQREIINTQNKLNTLKTEASSWNAAGKKLEEYGQKLEDLGTKADKVANKMTVGLTVPIVAGYTAMTKSAIENETAVQQVERIYGEAAEKIKEFAENKAIDYNMSASEAYKYSQIYGNLIQSITDDQTENAEQTQKLLQASSVIASSTGRSMEDVMDRIRSGLLGNTEAIEDLGVNVNVALLQTTDAFKQIAGDKSWDKLTFQEQQQVRLLGILEQTSKKYGDEVQDNTASSVQKLTAKTKNLTNSLGKKLLPIANKMLDKANDLIDKFGDLSDEQQENIVKIGLWVAAAGPLLKVGSTVITVTGKVTKGIGNITEAIGVASGKMTSTETSVNNLANVFKATFSPTGLAVLGITAAVGIITTEIAKTESKIKDNFQTMGDAAVDFYNDLQSAEGYLSDFNNTIFASTEEQENLEKQMDEIQAGITKICKTAADERRGYTQQEITQLNEYFTKLRELKDREIEIYQSRIDSITQLAEAESSSFQGTIEEYQERGTQWIATAKQQAQELISVAENRRIEEIAALNEMYSEEERLTNQNYKDSVAAAEQKYQDAVAAANKQVGEVSTIYANGYAQRANQDGDFAEHIKHYHWEQEEENKRYAQELDAINNNIMTSEEAKQQQRGVALSKHKEKVGLIWQDMYKNMSKSESDQMGSWIGMITNAEMYGGKLSDENQEIVDTILESYDHMPKDAREDMKNTMEEMLNQMTSSERGLFTKASGIAGGIISRLKASFNVDTSSLPGHKSGLDYVPYDNYIARLHKGERVLTAEENKQLMQMEKASKLRTPNMKAIGNSVVDSMKTVFTTPNITFNVQKMDEANLNSAFNYINKRLGSQY